MAKATKKSIAKTHIQKNRKKLGRHSKSESPTKSSKNYKKPYIGQGK